MKSAVSFLFILSLSPLALGLAGSTAHARPAFFNQLLSYYSSSTTPKTHRCGVCHESATAALNPYAQDFRKYVKGNGMGRFDFSLIEQLDSDGDGVKNGDEFRAGTRPGVKE